MISTVAINNQSVTVNQTGTSLSTSSVVLNRVYWFRRRQISPDPRPHKKSTKILGFGIFMIGIVILSVSLIIGIEFPLYVSRKILKDQCILEKKHVRYGSWVRDNDYRRINRVYFWVIENPDDFIKGLSTPKFAEKGPYMYRETRRKLNVKFSNHRLSYQTWVSQTFDAVLTQSECGDSCKENDLVSVLNTELLRKLHYFGGWDEYMKSQVTHLVSVVISELLDNYDVSDVYTNLGCVTTPCTNITWHGNHGIPLESLSFGRFVFNHNTAAVKSSLLNSNQFIISSTHFNTNVIKAMYVQLANTQTFREYSEATKQTCLNKTLGGNSPVNWSVYIQNITVLPTAFTTLYNDLSGNGTVYFSADCGVTSAVLTLLTYLQNFVSWSSVVWTLRVCDMENGAISCNEMSDSTEPVLSFLNLTVTFVDDVLLNIVTSVYKSKPENNVVWTKRQKELVLGYERSKEDRDPYKVHSMEGILDHYTDFVDAYHRSPVITVSTCLDGDTTDNNMFIREYGGKTLSPEGVHRTNQQPITGRTSCFPPSNTCRACVSPTPNNKEYDVFTEELQRSLKYGEHTETDIQDVLLHEFTVIDDDLRDSTSCGLINVTSVRNYPALIGNPYYMQSGCEYLERHTRLYSRNVLSYIKEEPLSGRFWERSTRLQTSVLIAPEFVGVGVKPVYKDMSHVGQPLPMAWVDSRVELVQAEIDTFESKINHLMRVSCGGLIGLTLVSFIIMGLSIFVGLLSHRKNKVQPVDEDTLPPAPE